MIEEKEEFQESGDNETPEQLETLEQPNEHSLYNEKQESSFEITNNFFKKDLLSDLKEKQEFSHQNSNRKKDVMGEDTDSFSQENEQDSHKEESNPYRFKSEQLLQANIKRIEKDIDILNKEDEHLTDEIATIQEQLRLTTYNADQRSLKRQLEQVKADRDICRQNREAHENQVGKISKELERRKKEGNESAEYIQSVSVQSLCLENEPIENTVLYVATFFNELSLSDFKRVVAKFLEKRIVNITKSQTIIEDGKSKIIEIQEEQSLEKKWEESVQEPNQADKI